MCQMCPCYLQYNGLVPCIFLATRWRMVVIFTTLKCTFCPAFCSIVVYSLRYSLHKWSQTVTMQDLCYDFNGIWVVLIFDFHNWSIALKSIQLRLANTIRTHYMGRHSKATSLHVEQFTWVAKYDTCRNTSVNFMQ